MAQAEDVRTQPWQPGKHFPGYFPEVSPNGFASPPFDEFAFIESSATYLFQLPQCLCHAQNAISPEETTSFADNGRLVEKKIRRLQETLRAYDLTCDRQIGR